MWWWGNEGDGEERDFRFWNDMDRTLDIVWNGYIFCILGDLNGWIGDRTRACIPGAFGIPGENDNGRRVLEFCEGTGLCVSNTYFKHRNLHKYTIVARGRDGVEIKSMIDLMLVKRNMLRYVHDVRAVRGMGLGLSDQYVVLCKARLVGAWIKRKEMVVGLGGLEARN